MMWLLLGAARVLTLEEALTTTERMQPTVQQAHAQAEAAEYRAKQVRGALMPQLTGNASYARQSANFVAQPGVVPQTFNQQSAISFATFDFWSFGATINQQIYDFHQTIGRFQASSRLAEAADRTEKQTLVDALLDTRAAYYGALAQKALVQVAEETLGNLQRQLDNTAAQAEVGRRPLVDVLQAKTLVANGKLELIRANNNYRIAKLTLNQRMGVMTDVGYEVKEEVSLAVEEETLNVETVVEQAAASRPDVQALTLQIKAQESTIVSTRGRFGPTLGAALGITERGRSLNNMALNFNVLVTLTWPLFTGLTDYYTWQEAHANKRALDAQMATLYLNVRLLVEQAKLDVNANLEALAAAEEAVLNARERLKLAQARYETGVGTALELADAQVQMTTQAANRVRAVLDVATARARLLAAVGRAK